MKVQMDLKLPYQIPTADEIKVMPLVELKAWKKRMRPYYYRRFRLNHANYLKVIRYIDIEKRIDNWRY